MGVGQRYREWLDSNEKIREKIWYKKVCILGFKIRRAV